MAENVGQTEKNENASCSVCGASMDKDTSRCPNCGVTRGEQHRCPFCRVVVEPEPDPKVRFRCRACGAPRVPLKNAADRLSKAVVEQLGAARRSRASTVAWTAASVAAVAFGLLSVLVLTGVFAIAHAPLIPVLVGYAMAALPFLFGVLGWRNAVRRDAEMRTALDSAWLEAAREFTTSRGIVRAEELSEALHLGPAEAQEMLVKLATLEEIRSDVTEAGDLAVSVRVAPRLRVPEASGSAADASALSKPQSEVSVLTDGEGGGKGQAGA